MKESLCNDFLNAKKVIYPFLQYGQQYLTGKSNFYPWAVEIHPTAKCNHRCIHCSYKERNENRAELSKKVFEQLIHSLIRMKCKGVYFSGGGEPCAYPYLREAVVKLKGNGVEVAVVSNGSLFESQSMIDVADHLNYIALSVPSCRSDMFERITGQPYVDRILKLPQRIHDRWADHSPIIGARVVITNLIATEVSNVLHTLKEHKFDYALFKIVRDYENRGLGVTEDMMIELKKEIESLRQRGDIDHHYTNLDQIFDYRKPYLPNGTCHINQMGLLAAVTPEGDVYHNISEIGKPDFLIGNLQNATLEEIWNSPRHLEVKRKSEELWRSGKCANCRSIAYNEIINSFLDRIPTKEDPFV